MMSQAERRLVAVMFTDMVGYTALMQADETTAVEKRDRYVRALDREHDAAGGTIVQRLGDGSLSMFPSVLSAVRAAVAMQRDLGGAGIPVRIGIHVGDVLVEPDRLTGDAVNVAARVESFAVPGSVFLSDTAYDQVKNQADLDVAALGSFQFKNVGRPFDLYAVGGDGLVVPERSELEGKGEAIVAIRSPLPEPRSELLGREQELADLAGLVRANRVVTMTGPGGVGKTRLATEVARTLAPEFEDGAAFAGFADVTDAAGFLPALAAALDVKEAEERSFADGIATLIGDREVLLFLDNLEQIVDAAPDIAGLATRCPGLKLLVTSRVPLRIAAERLYAVDPLPADDAVALFTARAEATSPGFDAAEHAEAIAEICRRLDGLPLAVELAAARVRLLGPEGLRDRLDRALELLTTGARDSHERQQTLRATIDWSYSLLEPPAQETFRRFAVFSGGCTLADAEAVAGRGTLDELESLIDAALVVQTDGRLRMLQTIADFAREQLDASGTASEVALQHARRYAVVAREIRDGIEGTEQVAAVARGFVEDDNLQAALDTFLAAAQAGDADAVEAGLQMSGDLWMYWHIRGKNLTARDNAAAFLAIGTERTVGRAGALLTAGLGSWMAGEIERSDREWAEAQAIADEIQSAREQCLVSFGRALSLMSLDPVRGLATARESFDHGRESGFVWGESWGATARGMLEAQTGDAASAAASFAYALDIQRRLEDWEGGGMSLGGLAALAAQRGDFDEALDLYRQSLTFFEMCGDRGEEARILSETAWTHLAAGDTMLARRDFFESVQAHTDIASVRGVGLSLIGLAAAEAVDGNPERAATIAAAAEVFAQEEGIAVVYGENTSGRALVDAARASLSAEALAAATEAGKKLSIDEALALAAQA